jgi:hypothetical protein
MNNPWKLATIGIALTGVIGISSGLTTAWMLRPTATAQADEQSVATMTPRPLVRYAATSVARAPQAVSYETAAASPVSVTPRVRTVSTSVPAAADDCSTGKDRAMRIAKPGLIGAVLGAGLGAAGGAIAKGGKGAGQGALIGGLGGAALGSGYGAYKTNNECGTILGNKTQTVTAPGSTYDTYVPAGTPQSAIQRNTAADAGQISIYNAPKAR